MIQISEEKKEKLSEMCEKMLHYGGKMMQCLESLEEEGQEGMENGGMRGGYRKGMRGGYRDDYDDYNEPMGMRRGGRRSRYDGEY